MVAPVAEDLGVRAATAAAAWRPGSTVEDLVPLPGGASSLTYAATLTGTEGRRRIVLKLAPPGLAPVGNRDVLRQARILRHLQGMTGVNVPAVLFEVDGEAPFFAMSHIEGESLEPILDELDELPPADEIRSRATAAARMLAALHSVPAHGPELGGEPERALADEVKRWSRSFETVSDDLRPGAAECGEALLATVPEPLPSTVLHGDFRLGNLLCRDGSVRAIIDWEIWSLGDPRVDLAWFLLFTHPDRLPVARRVADGMPSADELLGEYVAARGGGSLPDLAWFDALIAFKQAAVSALIVKHNRRRPDPQAWLERSATQIAPLLQRAKLALATTTDR